MSKNKGFSRVMALVLLICMVVSFAPAAYADVDEAPAVQEETVVEDAKEKEANAVPVSEPVSKPVDEETNEPVSKPAAEAINEQKEVAVASVSTEKAEEPVKEIKKQPAAEKKKEATKRTSMALLVENNKYIRLRSIQLGMSIQDANFNTPFDFSILNEIPMSLKLDVGASSYWSEITTVQTLDNLLMQGKIELVDYLERIPEGYVSKKQELIDKLQGAQAQMVGQQANGPVMGQGTELPVEGGSGYGQLQRALNKTGVT